MALTPDERENLLKVFDFAVAREAAFGSMFVSEAFGMFAVLALIGFSGARPLTEAFLTVVYLGLIGTMGLTYTRIAYFTGVMDEAETELGLHQRGDIEAKVREAMAKDNSNRGRVFWWMMKRSNSLAEDYLVAMVVVLVGSLIALIAALYH